MKILVCLLLLTSSLAWGGRAIRLSTQTAGNTSVPAQPVAQDCTVEMLVANFAHTFEVTTPCGISWSILGLGGGDFRLGAYWARNTSGSEINCQSPRLDTVLPSQIAYIRFSIDTTKLLLNCEIWDANLKRAWSLQRQNFGYMGSNGNGAFVPGSYSTPAMDYGFYRIIPSLIPFGGSAPYTAYNTGMLVHWKWDLGNNTGSLTDASGRGYNAVMSAGSPTYVAQAGQDIVIAAPKTCDAPEWATWRTQRIGITGQTLCGGESTTQADSTSLTYQWTQKAGPDTLTIVSPTAATTVVNGYATHGGFSVELKVTDAAMNTNTATLNYGAAKCDANGVLTPRNENVTKIYGPMVCFGYNPWGYMDERSLYMVGAQNSYFANDWHLDDASWTHTGVGTVAYPFGANGFGLPGALLHGDITASATTLVVDNAGNLPCLAAVVASGTPCAIYLGAAQGSPDSGNPPEVIRICGASAATGNNVTLTVCYDGRGVTFTNYQTYVLSTRQAWTNGTIVGSKQIAGTGTKFVTDTKVPLCPAGAGPPGPIVYRTGTVALTPNNGTVTGSGTVWNSGNGIVQFQIIRIEATHGGGTPFIYWSMITSITDTTHLEVIRTLPSDVDSGPFNYQILGVRYGAFGFTTGTGADTGHHLGWQPMISCESETLAFAMPARDISGLTGAVMTGEPYSYISGIGISSQFGPNFYGSGFALRSFYERSGYQLALDTARIIDNVWVKNPEIAGGWYGGFTLLQGGAAIGAIASKVLDPESPLDWEDDLIFWGTRGSGIVALGCQTTDARDSGYLAAWVVLNQLFDPNSTRHATWTSILKNILNRDKTCGAETGYSYAASGGYYNGGGPAVTLTTGSAAGTGTGIPSNICFGSGVQTVRVTKGDATATAVSGTFPSDSVYISINGVQVAVSYIDSTHVVMAVAWGGMSGTYPAMTRSVYGSGTNELTAWGNAFGYDGVQYNYMCVWNSSTSITLDRPWQGPNGEHRPYSGVLAGNGTQPFMLGIKLTEMTWATYSDNADIVSGYRTLLPLVTEWFKNKGYDAETEGLNYGVGFGACDTPAMTEPRVFMGYGTWIVPGCRFGNHPDQIRTSRALNAEAASALRSYYATTEVDRLTWGNEAYGAVWGYCPWTQTSYSCDANYVTGELSNTAMGSYKWPGFFFGMGMAHQWPAAKFVIPGPSGPRLNGRGSTTGDVQ